MAEVTRPVMQCPRCGAPMNAHAQKLIVTANTNEPGYDPQLGGVVDETNACPNCGNVDARRVYGDYA
jgi:ribosomal protein S27AE